MIKPTEVMLADKKTSYSYAQNKEVPDMNTIQEENDSNSNKPTQPLNKFFHVLITTAMYTELEVLSTRLKLSKAAIIRAAIEKYFHDLQERAMAPWTDLEAPGDINMTYRKRGVLKK